MPKSIGPTARLRLVMLVASSSVLAYGWWFTDRRPFSHGAFGALLVAVGVLIAVAVARRRRPPSNTRSRATREASHFRSAALVWSAVCVAVVAWELIALRSLPRSAHPTISSFVESAEQYHVVRVGLYAVWIALGWTLAS